MKDEYAFNVEGAVRTIGTLLLLSWICAAGIWKTVELLVRWF